MEYRLEPLRTIVLTNMEGGQLMKRHLTDLQTIELPQQTHGPFNTYIQDLTETYDLKMIRKEMMKKYNDFCVYVLSMSRIHDHPLFITALNLLNTARR